MRTMLAAALLLTLAGATIAQDAKDTEPTPAEKLAELEKRLEKLEKEAADLRRDLEELKRKLGTVPAGALWAFEIKSDLKGSGAIADVDGDDKLDVVFGSYFGEQHLFCIKAATGEISWKFKSDAGPLDASVAIDDLDGDGKPEIFSADSSSGHFYDLAGDGTLNWKFKLPNSTDSPVAIADLDGDGVKELVIGSMWQQDGKGAVSCYSARDHKLLWEQKYKGCIQSEPVLVDLNNDKTLDVIVTTWRGDHGIHAINGKNGKELWTFQTEGGETDMGMYHGVAVSGDGKTIFMATCQGDVYAINARGKQDWHKHYDDYLFSPITIADVNADKKEELIFGGHTLYCLAADDGKEIWQQPLTGGLDRGCAVTDADGDGDLDVLYNDHKAMVARDGKTGAETFRFEAGYGKGQWEEISSAPLVADFDGDGLMEAFLVIGQGTSDNEFKGNYGRVIAVKLKGKGPTWTTFRSNLRRTGNPAHD